MYPGSPSLIINKSLLYWHRLWTVKTSFWGTWTSGTTTCTGYHRRYCWGLQRLWPSFATIITLTYTAHPGYTSTNNGGTITCWGMRHNDVKLFKMYFGSNKIFNTEHCILCFTIWEVAGMTIIILCIEALADQTRVTFLYFFLNL